MDEMMAGDERRARLRLIRSQGIGPLTFRQLLGRFGSAIAAIEGLPDLAQSAGRRAVALADPRAIDRELAAADRLGMTLVTLGDASYPAPLSAIADPPPVLFAKGRLELAARDGIAIVGARNASAAGRGFARTLARDLGAAGVTVISGMARGIDGAAHEAALATGTIAVLAGGADSVYPPEHDRLYREIGERGLILSEQPLGYTARAQDFPKRNRIVSGLSRGVVVVEAAERSGTLITARLAAEQGRDVFAVPGSPLDPRSGGTNDLLRRGAILIRDAEDVLGEMRSSSGRLFEPPAPWQVEAEDDEEADAALRDRLLTLLSVTPTHRDRLIAEADEPAAAVAMALLDLVLEGLAAEEAGGAYVLSVRTESGGR